MATNNSRESSKSKRRPVAFFTNTQVNLIFALVIVWAWMLLGPHSHRDDSSLLSVHEIGRAGESIANGEPTESTLERINRHLQAGAKNEELQQLKMQTDNNELAPVLTQEQNGGLDRVDLANDPLNNHYLQYDDSSERISEDLHGKYHRFDNPVTPEQRINATMAMRQFERETERNYRRQMVTNIIAQARSQGVELQINDQLEVVGQRRLPKSSSNRNVQSLTTPNPTMSSSASTK